MRKPRIRKRDGFPRRFHSYSTLLSDREWEVYQLLRSGVKQNIAASILRIPLKAFYAHCLKVYSKIGIEGYGRKQAKLMMMEEVLK